MKTRLFPLEHVDMLVDLRELIYTTKNIEKTRAIIESMQLRGKTPLSVELTLLTMEAIHNPTVCTCSVAILRFINNILDSQQDSIHAVPLSQLCDQMSIPSYWIDIRHEIAHNSMPSLDLMIVVVEKMHLYLFNEFWNLLDKKDNEQYLWSASIINSFLLIDMDSTLTYLEKLKCESFFRFVCKEVPLCLITSNYVNDYVGYLAVQLAMNKSFQIQPKLEESFCKSLVYVCIANGITFPPKYIQLLQKCQKSIVKIGLLCPFKNPDSLKQLLQFNCDPLLIEERLKLPKALDVTAPNVSHNEIAFGSFNGDIEDQSWISNSPIAYIDPILIQNEPANICIDHKAFTAFKESILQQIQ